MRTSLSKRRVNTSAVGSAPIYRACQNTKKKSPQICSTPLFQQHSQISSAQLRQHRQKCAPHVCRAMQRWSHSFVGLSTCTQIYFQLRHLHRECQGARKGSLWCLPPIYKRSRSASCYRTASKAAHQASVRGRLTPNRYSFRSEIPSCTCARRTLTHFLHVADRRG